MAKKIGNSALLRAALEKVLRDHKQASLSLAQILDALDLPGHDKSILLGELKKMQEEGLIVKTTGGRFGLPERLDYLTGVLEGNRRGFAFLRPDRKENDDVYISPKNLGSAAHGDQVIVRIDQKRARRRREGTVIGIIKRGQNRLVGTLRRDRKKYYVVPDDRRFPGSVEVSPRDLQKAAEGDKVVVEVVKWSAGTRASTGRIVENIGPAGSPRTVELTFRRRYDLPGEFPEPVIRALEGLPGEEDILSFAVREKRADLRELKMVTIDDEQARDFDDAVSLEALSGNGWRLGVHIADVSHYVREGKAIDREALKRGTSIYLVERVIHMLPPSLSENLCSLQAGKNRLAVSVIMDIDANGELGRAEFYPSLIKVAERLTYQQVEAYLSGKAKEVNFKDQALPEMIDHMDQLAAELRKRRLARGALDLDLPEARIEVDEEGHPLAIEKRSMGRSESLIEEFMIYCNETVAQMLYKKKKPCIFRVHAVPTDEKLYLLRETLTLMGIRVAKNIKVLKAKHLKKLLEETKGETAERLVRYLVLRSLPQARYSAANEGHFGLASGCYCHFTSPIRRYPDLVVHRILKQQLTGSGLSSERVKRLQSRLPAIAEQSSERERAAVEAERADMDVKKAQYMEGRLGEDFSGIINGVTNFGLFVELDNTVEGMIPIGELGHDYYVYNEKNMSLLGERTRTRYRLGDLIRVKVVRANSEEGQVTFALADPGH